MLTIYDVLEIWSDEYKLQDWLKGYRVLPGKPECCVKCASPLKNCNYRGNNAMVCTKKGCRARVPAVGCGILEGVKLSLKQFVMLAYWWAQDCSGIRSENMLGMTLIQWLIGVLGFGFALWTMRLLVGKCWAVLIWRSSWRERGIHGHDNRVIVSFSPCDAAAKRCHVKHVKTTCPLPLVKIKEHWGSYAS